MKRYCMVFIVCLMSLSLLAVDEAKTAPPDNQPHGTVQTETGKPTETYGSTYNTWSGAPRNKGNLFSVTTSSYLTEMELYLGIPTADTIHFSIYRKVNDGVTYGTFDQVFNVDVTGNPNKAGWVSSGTMNYTLETGYYYYICASWDTASIDYYRDDFNTPTATGFGTLETGVYVSVGTPANPSTLDLTDANIPGNYGAYYQRLTFTEVPVELMDFSAE